MKFVYIENYYQTECTYGYLLITESDAADVHSREVGRFCGKRAPSPLTIMANQLNLYFMSNYSSRGRGFKIEYQFISVSGNFSIILQEIYIKFLNGAVPNFIIEVSSVRTMRPQFNKNVRARSRRH